MKTNEVVDRDDFLETLGQAMRSTEFVLVLGGKNLGKTLMRNQTVCELENEASANLTFIDVNMREHPSKELFKTGQGSIQTPCLGWNPQYGGFKPFHPYKCGSNWHKSGGRQPLQHRYLLQ